MELLRLYKAAYSGHAKEVWALSIFSFINRMGTMVIPFLTVYLTTELGYSLKEAGFLMGGFGIGALGGTFWGGKLADRIGPVKVMLISLFVSGALLISLQFAGTFNEFGVLIILTSFFGEAYRPAMSAAIGDYVPKEQTGRSMALIRLAINLGMSASPAIGGFVAIGLGYKWIFWIDGLTCVAAAIFLLFVAGSWQKRKVAEAAKQPAVQNGKSLSPYKNNNYLLFILGTFLMGIAFVQLFHTVPVFLKKEWGYDERYIGILLAMSSFLIVLFEMPIVDYVEKKGRIRQALLLGLFFMGITYLPFIMPSALIWCFIAYFLFSVGEIFVLPFNGAIPLHMAPPQRRGDYMSLYWMIWSVTNIVGPTLGLSFAAYFGFDSFWVFLMLLVGVSFAMNWVLGERIVSGGE